MTQHSQITEFSQRPQPRMDVVRRGAATRGDWPRSTHSWPKCTQNSLGYPSPYPFSGLQANQDKEVRDRSNEEMLE